MFIYKTTLYNSCKCIKVNKDNKMNQQKKPLFFQAEPNTLTFTVSCYTALIPHTEKNSLTKAPKCSPEIQSLVHKKYINDKRQNGHRPKHFTNNSLSIEP